MQHALKPECYDAIDISAHDYVLVQNDNYLELTHIFIYENIEQINYNFYFNQLAHPELYSIMPEAKLFNYNVFNEGYKKSIFKYYDNQLELDNFRTLNKVFKLVFGDLIWKTFMYKNFKEEDFGITEFNSFRVDLIPPRNHMDQKVIYTEFSYDKPLLEDLIFKKSLIERIKFLSSIELEESDITLDNLAIIGENVRAIIY